MSGNDLSVIVDQDGTVEAKLADARGNLLDLPLGMGPGVAAIGSKLIRRDSFDPVRPVSSGVVGVGVRGLQPLGVCTPLALGTERSDIGFSLRWRPLSAPPIFPLRGGVVGKVRRVERRHGFHEEVDRFRPFHGLDCFQGELILPRGTVLRR